MTILFLTGTFACAETVQRSESEQFRPDDRWFAQMAERDGQRLRQVSHETDAESTVLSRRRPPSTFDVREKEGLAGTEQAIASKQADARMLLVRSLRK